MNFAYKKSAISLTLILSIFLMPGLSFGETDTEDDSTETEEGSTETVTVTEEGSTDHFIPECKTAREKICEQIYDVDPSYFDDPSDIIEADDPTLATVCASYFSNTLNTGRKMKICHNGHTIDIANQAVCNGHLNTFAPGHENDSFGPCLNASDQLLELDNCINDDSKSSLFVSSKKYAKVVDDCPDTTKIDETGESISPKTGRMNFFEKLFN